jgi:hypothetical protein
MPPLRLRKRHLFFFITNILAVLFLPIEQDSIFGADYPSPPPPKEYQVEIRYQIYADLHQRIIQFQDLVRYLESVGFHKKPAEDPRAEMSDPRQTRMSGTIASGQVHQLLGDRRVKSLLIIPAGFKLPEDGSKPVKVQLELISGLGSGRQLLLADQVLEKLHLLGFREAIGYDHRGHTRLVGWIPVANLELLLQDLRWQPADWLAPEVPFSAVPTPLNTRSPILITEVLAEPQGPPKEPPARVPVSPDDNSQKISGDLRRLAAQAEAAKPTRMEVVLTYTPGEFETTWRRELVVATSGIIIQGRLGSVVTVLGLPQMANSLSALPIVSAVRLPVSARSSFRSAAIEGGGNQSLLKASGLARLHDQGVKGQGVRVAVIDGDFRGFEKLKGKGLPASTRYLDFTAERNPTFIPDPFPGDPQGIGQGTQFAQALILAAPDVQLTLIRVDPSCPYQVVEAARLIRGEPYRSESLSQRDAELTFEKARLRTRREDLRLERQAVLDDFRQDEELDREIVDRRKAYFKKLAELEGDERAYQQKLERFIKTNEDQRDLKGIQVIACSLVWKDGYALGGASALSGFFNDAPFPALWFEPAGNQRQQVWAGSFRDEDGTGVMEFTPPGTPLRSERWTNELNFLAWQPFAKEKTLDLPAKATIRISIQWQEVHDPEFAQHGDDVYREPLARLSLMVLRQRDPAGAQLPADDMELIARSEGLPLRIQNRLESATYQQVVEFSVPAAGRYALRVEGQVHPGTRPPSAGVLPGIERNWELQPRILTEAVDESSRLAGRPVWQDYFTDLGTIGVPSDAHGLITVGAASPSGNPETFSSPGPPMYLELLTKPDVLAFNRLKVESGAGPIAFGSGQANAFAAGQAAVLLSGRMPIDHVEILFHSQKGNLLRIGNP